MTSKLSLLFTLLLAGVWITPSFAAIANDSAADSVYDDGWQASDNGGAGFDAWVFGLNAPGNVSIASSTGNGGADDIDSAGRAFRLANDTTNDFVDVFRFLPGDLQAGETFSIDMDVNWRGGFKGIRVRDTDDSTSLFRFEVGNPGTDDDYIVYDALTGNGSIGNSYSDNSQFAIALNQTSIGGGTWSITRSGGISDLDTGTYTGQVSSLQLYTFQAGSDNEQAIYFNNLAVIPEPGTLALLMISGLTLFVLRRRKA